MFFQILNFKKKIVFLFVLHVGGVFFALRLHPYVKNFHWLNTFTSQSSVFLSIHCCSALTCALWRRTTQIAKTQNVRVSYKDLSQQKNSTRQSPWVEAVSELKQGRFLWRVRGDKFCLRFSIRYAFCPCGLPLFQLRCRFNWGTLLLYAIFLI